MIKSWMIVSRCVDDIEFFGFLFFAMRNHLWFTPDFGSRSAPMQAGDNRAE